MTVPVAFYGFQDASEGPRVVTEEGGWQGWFDDTVAPLVASGFPDHHVHNPFGLHAAVAGRDSRVMHLDQFDLSFCKGLQWLADRDAFADVVGQIHARGGTVRAYVGSPLVVGRSPQATFLPKCAPGSKSEAALIRFLRTVGLCRGCLCWDRLVRFHIDPLIDAGVDAIGFDASFDFHPGDCMDRLVRSLLADGIEILIEPWPRRVQKFPPIARHYPPVNWIIREVLYQRIQLNPRSDEAPLESVVGRIYRIVPDHSTKAGKDEFADINQIRENHGQPAFEVHSQQIVNVVREAGHIPVVRARQLASGDVT